MPQFSYSDIEKGLSTEQLEEVKKRGVLIVRGGVSKEVRAPMPIVAFDFSSYPQEALGWKRSIDEYITLNKDIVTGI